MKVRHLVAILQTHLNDDVSVSTMKLKDRGFTVDLVLSQHANVVDAIELEADLDLNWETHDA